MTGQRYGGTNVQKGLFGLYIGFLVERLKLFPTYCPI